MEDDKPHDGGQPKPETPATESPVQASEASPPSSLKKKKKKKKVLSADGPMSTQPMSAQPETVPEGERAKKKKKKKKSQIDPNPPARVDAETLDRNLGKIKAKVDAHEAARAGFQSDPGIEDESIPPVVEDHFFTAGDAPKPVNPGMSGSFTGLDPRHAQKLTAEAAARRAHLSRYVKGAIAFCALLLVIGIVKVSFFPSKTHGDVRVASSEVTIPQTPPPPQVTAKVPVDVPAAPTETQQVVDTAPITDLPDEPAADAGLLMEKEPLPVDQPPARTAAQEKGIAKAALESGNNFGAIGAGERSVALDSSDGETWLILGAAYQASGNETQAKRCFKACISQGRRGPIDECRQMLGP